MTEEMQIYMAVEKAYKTVQYGPMNPKKSDENPWIDSIRDELESE